MKPSAASELLAATTALLLTAGSSTAAPSVFNFSNPADRFAATSGTATLAYWDPDVSEWGPAATTFGKASSFGLPAMTGGDPEVMGFPACTSRQGFSLLHGTDPNGSYADVQLISNYTLIFDICYPSASDGQWRSLVQTNTANGDDGEFFVQDAASGGVGINSNYRGRIVPGQWHRIAISVRAAPGEGQAQRYVDGQFAGAIGTTGSALEQRFALGPEVLLLTDNDSPAETAAGFLSSFLFVDRAMTGAEISALGGPHANGANVPGPAAPDYAVKMSRRPAAIGHRGGSFGSAPDNTLAALSRAFLEGAAGVEVDTRLTADGVAVCFHDETVERTTDGFGFVTDLTVAQLKELDAGSKYDPVFAGERVPTLAEALTAAKGKGIVYLDIKTGDQAAAIVSAINATSFPLSDLWFWRPGDTGLMDEIRAAFPAAKIFEGNPDASWNTDPDYFTNLRSRGVTGFSMGTGTNTPDAAFVARAKQEGFIVEVFTINDPDTMLRCAEAGVDYMETDFPATLAALQPPQLAKASLPGPGMGAVVNASSVRLQWVPGTGATAHRVHFGTVNPPPLVAEQTSDLHQADLPTAGTTYYWRIDEVTSSGTVPGEVWSFSTQPPAAGNQLEWGFNGSLDPLLTTAGASLVFADGAATEQLVQWETSDDFMVPHIGGEPVSFVRIPAFTEQASGFSLSLGSLPANGGGPADRILRHTMIFDILVPSGFNWVPFFNTDRENDDDDADLFISSNGSVGKNADDLGYSSGGVIPPDTWKRVAWVADLPAGTLTIYVDGVPVKTRSGAALPPTSRWALTTGAGAGPAARLFNDNDDETSPVLLAGFAFTDVPLTAGQIQDLGGPRAGGIFHTPAGNLPPLTIQQAGNSVTFTWTAAPGRRLQRSTSLSGGWTDVPGTAGTGTHTETIVPGSRLFFRAAQD